MESQGIFQRERAENYRQFRSEIPTHKLASTSVSYSLALVIRDDPQKGGMYNRQGLSVKQIWECSKDYDMWPLYILGLLFGLPKYPVNQYLTISFRGLGFNVIETNLLSIPNIIGSCIMMLLITALSEAVNNRSFVSMAEDAWLLPCFAALIALPDPIGSWVYFAIATVLLSFPW